MCARNLAGVHRREGTQLYRHERRAEILISRENQNVLRAAGRRDRDDFSRDDGRAEKSSSPRASDSYLLPSEEDRGWNPPPRFTILVNLRPRGAGASNALEKGVNGDSIEWQGAIK